MEDAWLCWEADADGLGGMDWILDSAGGSGQPWLVQAVSEILETALLCPKPLSQSRLEFCRGVNTIQDLPTSWFCHLLVSAGEGGDVKLSSPLFLRE